jgi:hypothetical protein
MFLDDLYVEWFKLIIACEFIRSVTGYPTPRYVQKLHACNEFECCAIDWCKRR